MASDQYHDKKKKPPGRDGAQSVPADAGRPSLLSGASSAPRPPSRAATEAPSELVSIAEGPPTSRPPSRADTARERYSTVIPDSGRGVISRPPSRAAPRDGDSSSDDDDEETATTAGERQTTRLYDGDDGDEKEGGGEGGRWTLRTKKLTRRPIRYLLVMAIFQTPTYHTR